MTKNFILIAAAMLSAATVCHATIVSLTLTPDSESGQAGSTVTFSANLQNQTAEDIFLNELDVELPGLPPSVIDLGPFFAGPIDLPGFTSSGVFSLFNIVIPDPVGTGPFGGTVLLLGGPDPADLNVLEDSAVTFTVNITPTTVALPEPSTFWVVPMFGLFAVLRARNSGLLSK